jgi:ATP-dependent DNA ligase
MFRYPDKPAREISRQGLAILQDRYLAQLKMDGWRCVIERTPGFVTFTSRHGKPIPISREVAEPVTGRLLELPIGTILDAEWLARRPSCHTEALWLFDLMQYGRLSLWHLPTAERFAMLRSVVPAEWIVPSLGEDAEQDYVAFFDAMRDRPDAEGLVLKCRTAKYIGSFRQSADNPGWLKCKWRAGESGMTKVA